ncbi:nucleotidyltransferase domain-containing protein [soil metagenome]
MTSPQLTERELDLITGVIRHHPRITKVKLFGSRAMGTHSARSDVDLAVWGAADAVEAEAVAGELDDLPLPYRFEVQSFEHLTNPALREHIERVGISLIPEDSIL